MPNWCNNTATLIIKDEAKKAEVLDAIQNYEDDSDKNSFLGYFVPEPDYDTTTDDVMPGWYWWRVNNWGTKWDIQLYHWDVIDDTITIGFDTAWAPPIGAYESMAENHGIEVVASYYEPGCAFCGTWDNENREEHYEYGELETPEAVREHIGEDLDDEWGISEDIRQWIEENEE